MDLSLLCVSHKTIHPFIAFKNGPLQSIPENVGMCKCRNIFDDVFCRDRVTVSELFVKVWEGEGRTLREERRDCS